MRKKICLQSYDLFCMRFEPFDLIFDFKKVKFAFCSLPLYIQRLGKTELNLTSTKHFSQLSCHDETVTGPGGCSEIFLSAKISIFQLIYGNS